MNNEVNLGAKAVLFTVQTKRKEVLLLLFANGIKLPADVSNNEIAIVATDVMKKSVAFRKDFMSLLERPETIQGLFANANGEFANFTGTGFENYFKVDSNDFKTLGNTSGSNPLGTTTTPSTTTATTATPPPPEKPGFWGSALNILQTGVNSYLQLDKNKTDRAIADASVKTAQYDTEGKLITSGTGMAPPPKSNTTVVVVSVVAGLALTAGIVYYLVTKKK